MAFQWLLPCEHTANETKDNKNGTSPFANSVWMTKNNVKANIWNLYMKFEANKEFMENLSLHYDWSMTNKQTKEKTKAFGLLFKLLNFEQNFNVLIVWLLKGAK